MKHACPPNKPSGSSPETCCSACLKAQRANSCCMPLRGRRRHAKRSRRFADFSTNMKGTADDYSDKLDQSGSHAIAGMGLVAFSLAGGCIGGARSGGDGCVPQARSAIPDRGWRVGTDARRSDRDVPLLCAAPRGFRGFCSRHRSPRPLGQLRGATPRRAERPRACSFAL